MREIKRDRIERRARVDESEDKESEGEKLLKNDTNKLHCSREREREREKEREKERERERERVKASFMKRSDLISVFM